MDFLYNAYSSGRRLALLVLVASVVGSPIRTASGQVTLFGDEILPLIMLPIEFAPTSGVEAVEPQTIGSLSVSPGDYVIGGGVGSEPAVMVVTPSTPTPVLSSVLILPSLDVFNATGSNTIGLVRDTIIIDGQVHFVGHSWSGNGLNDLEATVWLGDVPTGYGFVAGSPQVSEFFAGTSHGLFVGRSPTIPALSLSSSTMIQLPGTQGNAAHIRDDGGVIVGEVNFAPAYWRPDGLGGWTVFENTLELPADVLNAGSLFGAQRHRVFGEALNLFGEPVGGIWDVNDGELLEIFEAGTSVSDATTLAGHGVFAVNSPGAPNPPRVFVTDQGLATLLDVFGGDLTGTGLTVLNEIVDVFPGSAVFLGLGEDGTQGRYFIGSVMIHPDADYDMDGDVDGGDVDLFSDCFSGPAIPHDPGCETKDFDNDGDVDQTDFAFVQRSLTAP